MQLPLFSALRVLLNTTAWADCMHVVFLQHKSTHVSLRRLPSRPPATPQQSLKRAQRAEFGAGDVILDSPACHTTLVLLVDGLATFTFKDAQARVPQQSAAVHD